MITAGVSAIEICGRLRSAGTAAGGCAPTRELSATQDIRTMVDVIFISHLLRVATNATLLLIGPAGVDTGTSTSNRCSLEEPQGIDCISVCSEDLTGVPSMRIACE